MCKFTNFIIPEDRFQKVVRRGTTFSVFRTIVEGQTLLKRTLHKGGIILDNRQKSFARAFSHCFDAKTAAILIGIPPDEALSEGQRLISQPAVRRRIEKHCLEKLRLYDSVRAGLEKIAFGRCNDAVLLAFTQKEALSPSLTDGLDLSLISAIKRDKDGGVDIKLYDRLKALEALIRLDEAGSSESAAQSFLSALGGDDDEE